MSLQANNFQQALPETQPGHTSPAKNTLRQTLRHARRALTRQQQKQASLGLSRQLSTLSAFQRSRRVAAYIPNDGEIDPQPLLELAWRLGKQVYLPVLHPFEPGQLLFMEYQPGQPLAKNRFGIPEPVCDQDSRCPTWMLDLVLTPLVGFDEAGHRMGMGGGFYDRSFAFLKTGLRPRQPTLIGVAHECQKVDALPCEPWDIPMQHVITDQRSY